MTTSEKLVQRRNSSSSSHIWGQNVLTVKHVLAYLLITVLANDQIYALATNLGSKCQHDMDCTDFIKGSTCSANGYCECAPYFVQYNATSCLSSQLLGGDCFLDDQCTMKVANSSCLDGACRCVEGFLQFRKHTCLGPAHPGAVCYSHAHCQMFDGRTHCDFLIPNLFGRCQCTAPAKLKAGVCVDVDGDLPSVIATTEKLALITSTTTPSPPSTTVKLTTQSTTTTTTRATTTTTEAPLPAAVFDDIAAETPADSIEEAEIDDDAKIFGKPLVEDEILDTANQSPPATVEVVQTTPQQQMLTIVDIASTEGSPASATEQLATIAEELPATEDYPYKIEDDYMEEHDVHVTAEEEHTAPVEEQQAEEQHQVEEHAEEQHQVEEQAEEEHQMEEHAVEEHLAEEHAEEEHPEEEQVLEEHKVEEDENKMEEHVAEDHQEEEHVQEILPVEEHAAEEHQAEEHVQEEHEAEEQVKEDHQAEEHAEGQKAEENVEAQHAKVDLKPQIEEHMAEQQTQDHMEEQQPEQHQVEDNIPSDTMNFDYETSHEEETEAQNEIAEDSNVVAMDKEESVNSDVQSIDAAAQPEATEKIIIATDDTHDDDEVKPSSSIDTNASNNSQHSSIGNESESVADAQIEAVVADTAIPEAIEQKIDVIPETVKEESNDNEDIDSSSNVQMTANDVNAAADVDEDKGTQLIPEEDENNDAIIGADTEAEREEQHEMEGEQTEQEQQHVEEQKEAEQHKELGQDNELEQQQQDIEQITDAPVAELNEAIKPVNDDTANEVSPIEALQDKEQQEQISIENSNTDADGDVADKEEDETAFQTNDNGGAGDDDENPQKLATAIETEEVELQQQHVPEVEQETPNAEQHEEAEQVEDETQHEQVADKVPDEAPQEAQLQQSESEDMAHAADHALEVEQTAGVPNDLMKNEDEDEIPMEQTQNIGNLAVDIGNSKEQTTEANQESNVDHLEESSSDVEKDLTEFDVLPEASTEIPITADNQVNNENIAVAPVEDAQKEIVDQVPEKSVSENEIEGSASETNEQDNTEEQPAQVQEIELSNTVKGSAEADTLATNENVAEMALQHVEQNTLAPAETLSEEISSTIQPAESDYSNVESFEELSNESSAAAEGEADQLKEQEPTIVEETPNDKIAALDEEEPIEQPSEIVDQAEEDNLKAQLTENESIADILNDLIHQEEEEEDEETAEEESTTLNTDAIETSNIAADLVADETQISESNAQNQDEIPQIVQHEEVPEGTTELHVNNKLITFYPDVQAAQSEQHLEEPVPPVHEELATPEKEENPEEGSALSSIDMAGSSVLKSDFAATTMEEPARTLSPEELPFDMSMDEIQPHELESDNLILESTTSAPEAEKESSAETDEANEIDSAVAAVDAQESSGDDDLATSNPSDIVEITTQTMLGLASRVTLMEPAAPVVTTLKPLMAEAAPAAAEVEDNEPTPEPSKEGSSLEGIMTTKATTEIRKRVELGLEAVSLGLACINDKQCQLADPNTYCNARGVCDCLSASVENQCSAARTGCSEGTFQCRASGVCISWFFVCDGRPDCNDASDEECTFNARLNQTCPAEAFHCVHSGRCISRAALCDGRRQCPHGEDEIGCNALKSGNACPPHTFRCKSGECLPEYEYCNAIISCRDGSDEPPHMCGSRSVPNFLLHLLNAGGLMGRNVDAAGGYCPHKCSNGRCRSTAIVCSGRDGCGDGTDEQTCAVCRCAAPPASETVPAFIARHRPMPLW